MQQYLDLRAENPGAVLLFRLGDFYEAFFGDAVTASRALDIVLSARGTDDRGVDIPMCGIPWHAAENYISRLIKRGITVAIAEQMETPDEMKARGGKQMERQVVRVITPGTLTDENLLAPKKSNFLVAYNNGDIAAVDISTGEFFVGTGDVAEVQKFDPAEVLYDEAAAETAAVKILRRNFTATPLHIRQYDTAEMGETAASKATLAQKMIFSYIARTQKAAKINIGAPRRIGAEQAMSIDASTWKSLEIDTAMNDGGETLIQILDKTKTAAGGRLLRSWLRNIPVNLTVIGQRQSHIEHFVKSKKFCEDLAGVMKTIPDISRSITRLVAGRGFPRDIMAARAFLEALPALQKLGQGADPVLAERFRAMETFPELTNLLSRALSDRMPALFREGGIIRENFDAALDDTRKLAHGAREFIAELAGEYGQRAGVTLKIKFNNVIGYFIEVTEKNAPALMEPDSGFIHRQTLTDCVRFTTPRLAELDIEIKNAQGKAGEIEAGIILSLIEEIRKKTDKIFETAAFLAEVDIYLSLAETAEFWEWSRPIMTEDQSFEITGGRHPIVEKTLREKSQLFVKNDSDLSGMPIALLTGPNMAGKSTYLRQNALIVILAHLGSFVPAKSAKIGLTDQLFSRVGASDNLASGQSTFMVEMSETANILNNATKKSFIIFDEIGRGTATYDGMAIAEAVLEYTAGIGARCLFATHYHELTKTKFPGVRNLTIKVAETDGDIVFLHKIIDGVASRSYGVHVAKMAGMPASVIESAMKILASLEKDDGRGMRDDVTNASLTTTPPLRGTPSPAKGNDAAPIEDADGQLSMF